jgi:hypothetical protein
MGKPWLIGRGVLLILWLITSAGMSQDTAQKSSFRWKVGEELLYKVKWAFIKLGELKLSILNKDTLNNRPVYHCRINVDSSPGLPFITIHDTYESFVDSAQFYSHLFRSYEKKGSHLVYTEYIYSPDSQKIEIRVENRQDDKREIVLDSVATNTPKMFDSLSMLYFARGYVKLVQQVEIEILMNAEFVKTDINFRSSRDEIEFNRQSVNCFYLDGRLKFVGIAGVKDEFKGWFSPGRQSVPIIAKMKAFIGSVGIELIRWKNWED